ncbi:hypothetical protein RKD26_006655 [Streptomyces calvus]
MRNSALCWCPTAQPATSRVGGWRPHSLSPPERLPHARGLPPVSSRTSATAGCLSLSTRPGAAGEVQRFHADASVCLSLGDRPTYRTGRQVPRRLPSVACGGTTSLARKGPGLRQTACCIVAPRRPRPVLPVRWRSAESPPDFRPDDRAARLAGGLRACGCVEPAGLGRGDPGGEAAYVAQSVRPGLNVREGHCSAVWAVPALASDVGKGVWCQAPGPGSGWTGSVRPARAASSWAAKAMPRNSAMPVRLAQSSRATNAVSGP